MRFTFLRLAPLWATLSASGPLHAAASLLVDDAGTHPGRDLPAGNLDAPACQPSGTDRRAGVHVVRHRTVAGAEPSAWRRGHALGTGCQTRSAPLARRTPAVGRIPRNRGRCPAGRRTQLVTESSTECCTGPPRISTPDGADHATNAASPWAPGSISGSPRRGRCWPNRHATRPAISAASWASAVTCPAGHRWICWPAACMAEPARRGSPSA